MKTWTVWFRYSEEMGQVVTVDAADQLSAVEEACREYKRLYDQLDYPIWTVEFKDGTDGQ